MIRLRSCFSKFISVILAFVISFNLMITPSYAGAGAQIDAYIEFVKNPGEYTQEAMSDMMAKESAGDWGQAVFRDFLPWNFFHNEVQKKIINQYESAYGKSLQKEKGIDFKFTDGSRKGELTGKSGRADIYLEKDDEIYIWEVKPYSYKVSPRREEALIQLDKYIFSTGDNARRGGMTFDNGVIFSTALVLRPNSINEVVYRTDYYVEPDGLILYKFAKIDERIKYYAMEEVPEHETVRVPKPYVNALSPVVAVVNDLAYENSRNTDTSRITPKYVYALTVVAIAVVTATAADNSNSVSVSLRNNGLKVLTALAVVGVTSVATATTVKASDIDSLSEEQKQEILEAAWLLEDTLEVIFGDEDAFDRLFTSYNEAEIDELINSIRNQKEEYEAAGVVEPVKDPVVIDLGEDGIHIIPKDEGVNFDIDSNGYAEKTEWISAEDGFLAVDINGNGTIDNGAEMFTNYTGLPDGTNAMNGFEALAIYDSNNDSFIDSDDLNFDELLIWTDVNQNGISETGELKTFSELNVEYINLNTKKTKISNDYAKLYEFWFEVDSTDSTHNGNPTSGNIPNFWDMVISDDEICDLYCRFSMTRSIYEKRSIVREILYKITGADQIETDSRGTNIDARNLHVVEQFMGYEFSGISGSDPNSAAAVILNEIMTDIEDDYYTMICMYGELGGYMPYISRTSDDDGRETIDLTLVNAIIQYYADSGRDVESIVYELGIYLKCYDRRNRTTYFQDYCNTYGEMSEGVSNAVKFASVNSIIYAIDDSDSARGTTVNDYIIGNEQNNIIYGNAGDDTVVGEDGNDILYGDYGADTYVFNTGDGNDIIHDYENGTSIIRNDRIVFGAGIYPEDVELERKGNNLEIRYGENDVITVEGMYNNIYYAIEYIGFTDGTEWDIYKIGEEAHNLLGTSEADTIEGYSSVSGYDINEVIKAGESNDTVRGEDGNDTLYGEAGNDTLHGNSENDILIGGTGNDTLYGDYGNDTYIFNIGDGNDVIHEYESTTSSIRADRIVFGEGISPETIELERKNKNLEIRYGENDVITVEGMYNNIYNAIEYIEFTDGTEWDIYKIGEEAHNLLGTSEADTIEGYSSVSGYNNNEVIKAGELNDLVHGLEGNDTIYGEAGNDTLYGDSENDTLIGGTGNDTLYGGYGADTYVFNIGDGSDVLYDYENGTSIIRNDGIVFGEGISPETIELERKNKNLEIRYGENDVITVEGMYNNIYNAIEYIEFTDGTKWDIYKIGEEAHNLSGTSESDNITGYSSVSGYNNNEVIKAGESNDTIRGAEGNDTLYGEAGNDTLYGDSENDTLIGGIGNDILYGNYGDDTYVFNIGDGNDVIHEYENSYTSGGADRIVFGEGISPENIELERKNKNLEIRYGENDVITVEGMYNNIYYAIEYIEFTDGTEWDIYKIGEEAHNLLGTSESDNITGYSSVSGYNNNEVIKAGESNDTIRGAEGNDTLYGEAGNDTLYGGSENDTLIGGTGNDTLYGDYGNDTYIFNIGDGNDVIHEYESSYTSGGADRIVFGEGINQDSIELERKGNNLEIRYGENDVITIESMYKSVYYRVEYIEFADGTCTSL